MYNDFQFVVFARWFLLRENRDMLAFKNGRGITGSMPTHEKCQFAPPNNVKYIINKSQPLIVGLRAPYRRANILPQKLKNLPIKYHFLCIWSAATFLP